MVYMVSIVCGGDHIRWWRQWRPADRTRRPLTSRNVITATRSQVSAHPRYIISRTQDILVFCTTTSSIATLFPRRFLCTMTSSLSLCDVIPSSCDVILSLLPLWSPSPNNIIPSLPRIAGIPLPLTPLPPPSELSN